MQEKHKWLLVFIVSAAMVSIAVIAGVVKIAGEQESGKKKSGVTVRSYTPALKEADIRERLEEAKTYVPPDPLAEMRETVNSHWARYEEAPDDPEAPVLLEAMGNLYTLRLQDYAMAVYCYQQLLLNHPDYNRGRVYIGLVNAYEKAGDKENETRIYNEMIREFPEESVEYQWAADRVGEKRWEGPEVIHPGSPEEAELIKKTEAAFAAARAEGAAESEATSEGESEVTEGEPVPEEIPDVVEGEAKL